MNMTAAILAKADLEYGVELTWWQAELEEREQDRKDAVQTYKEPIRDYWAPWRLEDYVNYLCKLGLSISGLQGGLSGKTAEQVRTVYNYKKLTENEVWAMLCYINHEIYIEKLIPIGDNDRPECNWLDREHCGDRPECDWLKHRPECDWLKRGWM